jgi:hypothetical protein
MRMQARQVQHEIRAMRMLPIRMRMLASLMRMRMQARQVDYAIRAPPPGKSPPVYPPCNSRSDASSDACRYSVYLLYWYKSTNTDAIGGCPARLALASGAQVACFSR